MEQKKLTPRQVEFLSGELLRRHVSTTTPLRNAMRSAGYLRQQASKLVARELGHREWDLPLVVRQQLPPELVADVGGLSVAGMEALRAHLRGGRVNDPTDPRLAEIERQLPLRRELDAKLDKWLADYRTAQADLHGRMTAARDKATAEDSRQLLVKRFGMVASIEDAELLQLAKAVEGLQHGYGYVRHLDDADLSTLLDEAEKEAVRPGTLGDTMRSEKIAAVRAEFARRAGR